jgi:signal transduction histidine kinase
MKFIFIKKISFVRTIQIGFSIILSFSVIMSIIALYELFSLNKINETLRDNWMPSISRLSNISISFDRYLLRESAYINSKQKEDKDEYKRGLDSLRYEIIKNEDACRELIIDEEVYKEFETYEIEMERFFHNSNYLLNLSDIGKADSAKNIRQSKDRLKFLEVVRKAFSDLVKINVQRSIDLTKQVDTRFQYGLLAIGIFLTIIILSGVVIARFFQKELVIAKNKELNSLVSGLKYQTADKISQEKSSILEKNTSIEKGKNFIYSKELFFKIPFFRTIQLGFTIILSFSVIMSIIALYELFSLNRINRELRDNWMPSISTLRNITDNFDRYLLRENAYIVRKKYDEKVQLKQDLDSMTRVIEENELAYKKLILSEKVLIAFNDYEREMERFFLNSQYLRSLADQGKADTARTIFSSKARLKLLENVRDDISGLVRINVNGGINSTKDGDVNFRYGLLVIGISLIVIIISGIVIARFFTSFLNKTLQKEQLNNQMLQEKTEALQNSETALKQRNELIESKNQELEAISEELRQQNEVVESKNQLLEQLQQAKDDFTGMVVHDLRNPLNPILSFSNEESSQKSPLELRENLFLIQKFGKRIEKLIDNILDIQKYENAEIPLDLANHNIYSIAQEAIEQIAFFAQQKGLSIHNQIASGIIARFDSALIARVFENFLTNAIKYTPNGGQITLKSSIEENQVKISIHDTGEGIPADKIDKIFDRFAQIEARKYGYTRSTGIGLTFCKMALTAHQSEIKVKSDLGQGAEFSFYLPLVAIDEKLSEITQTIDNQVVNTISLNSGEKTALAIYIQHLQEYDLAVVENYKNELEQYFPPEPSENLRLWHSQLWQAVDNLNQSAYEKLLAL